MKKEQILEAIMCGVPYCQHIRDIDLDSENEAIRFTWRGNRFRVSCTGLMVEECIDGCLHGNDLAILMEQAIKFGMKDVVCREAKVSP